MTTTANQPPALHATIEPLIHVLTEHGFEPSTDGYDFAARPDFGAVALDDNEIVLRVESARGGTLGVFRLPLTLLGLRGLDGLLTGLGA